MKSLLKNLMVVAVAALVCSVPAVCAGVESGQPAPDFTFSDLTGKPRKLSEFRGKVVILEWLNPACPYVVRHYRSGNMQSTQAVAAADGAIWLQVNSTAMGDLDAVKSAEWQKKQGVVATAYIRDQSGRIGRIFGAQTTPHCYVIGRDGTLVYQGAVDDQSQATQANTPSAHNYVKAALTALQAGRLPEVATTPPYGCGVKYAEGP